MQIIKNKIIWWVLAGSLLISFNLQAALPINNQGYIEVDGGKLFFTTFGLNTSKSPIIVLHSGPGALDHTYLLPQMMDLALDRQVAFYDQRGSGQSLSFTLNHKTININTFVKDLETLRIKLGYKKFTLIGHSWGGILALNYALKYPQNIANLVLLASAPHNTKGFQMFLAEYHKRMQPLQANLTSIESSDKFKRADPNILIEYYRLVFSKYFYNPNDVAKLSLSFNTNSHISGNKVAMILMQDYLLKYDLSHALKKLKVPTLIIHGANDIVPLATAKATSRLLPNARLVVIPQCDHFPYIEQPQEFLININNLN